MKDKDKLVPSPPVKREAEINASYPSGRPPESHVASLVIPEPVEVPHNQTGPEFPARQTQQPVTPVLHHPHLPQKEGLHNPSIVDNGEAAKLNGLIQDLAAIKGRMQVVVDRYAGKNLEHAEHMEADASANAMLAEMHMKEAQIRYALTTMEAKYGHLAAAAEWVKLNK